MRIALISHASHANAVGGDGLVSGLRVHAQSLAQLGHYVQVFAAGPKPSSDTESEGVDCTFFARDGALRRALVGNAGFGLHRVAEALADASDAVGGLRRRLREGAFDVVEVVGDGVAAGLVALCDGVPALIRSTGIWSPEGSTAERFAAARLAKLGMRAARAVSVPSFWLRDHLAHAHIFQGTTLVVPDAVAAIAPATSPEGPVDGQSLFVWFDGGDRSASQLQELLSGALTQHPGLRVILASPPSGSERLAALQSQFADAGSRFVTRSRAVDAPLGLPEVGALGLFWTDHAPVCPPALLSALAAGLPLIARGVESVPEAIRHDVDGLLFDTKEAASRKLERLLRTDSLRERLGRAAHKRAATRFDPLACSRRRLQVYEWAAGQRPAKTTVTVGAATPEAVVLLGPDNWFDAWWLAGAERKATQLARDAAGKPTLLGLPYEELKLVEAVLVRTWCDGPKDWSAPEWAELHAFDVQVLDRLDELRRRGEVQTTESVTALGFPPPDHPMFAPDQGAVLLAEVWRLEHHARFNGWLSTAVAGRDFVVRAAENVHLRRIAVEAAKRVPAVSVFNVLRRIYRDAKRHDQVVDADREFLARGGSEAFASGIAELGLHAPLAHARFPTARRPRRKAAALQAVPRITVLIPSFRHEGFVGLAIESCLRQSIRDLRVLVADDQSPDGTVAAARAIDDPRLRVHVNASNLGLGASVLAALEQIDTPYVALLNSDDLFHPERLERCLAVLEADPSASLVATGFAVVDRNGAVLTHATSCAAEIGPPAHGWLRWFEGISRDELHRPEDWTSFDVLLRHNVLATSSNMVFRTDWLRQHMPEASRLKYCVDWQLFLQAAMEGSLRMVEGQLLAYRLHDTNTVWFREGGRADYVFEVNRVVDRVLSQWLERAVARDGAGPAVERLAHILEHDVRHHGETDGLALYLSDLARRFASNQVDPKAAPIAALAEAALRRNLYGQVIKKLDVDPWSLPWRAQIADRWRLEHDVAEGYVARARALDTECGRLRIEQASQRSLTEDLQGRCQRIEQELAATQRDAATNREAANQRHAAALAEAQAANDELRARLRTEVQAAMQRADVDLATARERFEAALADAERVAATERATASELFEARLADAQRIAAIERNAASELFETRLAEAQRLAATERANLLAEAATSAATARAEIDATLRAAELAREEALALQNNLEARSRDLQHELDAQNAALATLTGEAERLERLGNELVRTLDDRKAELEQARAEITVARAEREALVQRLAAIGAERDTAREEASRQTRLRDLAIDSTLAQRSALAKLQNSPAWHLGDRLMRKVGVLQTYKTLAALGRQGHALVQRGGWHLGRLLTAAGRARTGVVVFGDSLDGPQFDERSLRWLQDGAETPQRLVAWSQGLPRGTPHDVAEIVRKRTITCHWLTDDARLDRSDRAYFASRNPTAVEELDRQFGGGPWPFRAYRGTRVAKTTGAGLAIAQGLRAGAIQAYACKRLCGIRFVLALGDEDLLDLPFGRDAAVAVLAAADLLVVDSDLVLHAVERLTGSLPARSIVRWAISPEAAPPPRAGPEVRAFVHWPSNRRADPETLVAGVQQAVAAGVDLRLDVVGNLGEGPAGTLRWLQFQDLLAAAGLGERFRLHGAPTPKVIRNLLDGADLVLWIGRSVAESGLPQAVVEGLARGKPVVASGVRELLWLPALAECIEIVPPVNAEALAQTLVRHSKDPRGSEPRLQAAREVLTRRTGDEALNYFIREVLSPTPDIEP